MTADLAKYTDLHLFAQAYPERFELVAQLPNPDTYIFKLK